MCKAFVCRLLKPFSSKDLLTGRMKEGNSKSKMKSVHSAVRVGSILVIRAALSL
jgi:hypothetical protein